MKSLPKKVLGNGWLVLISVIIALLTFPRLNPVYANGIDPPLSWVFNYLIRGKLMLGKDIIFPHGPLAFIMYPLTMGANLWVAFAVSFLVRVGFVYSLVSLKTCFSKFQLINAVVFSFVLLALFDVLLVIIGLVIMGYLNYLKSREAGWLLVSFALSVCAIYIKAFVGIVCGITTLAYFGILIIEIVRNETSPKQLYFAFVPTVLLISAWLIMYGTVNGLTRYLYGMMQLAGDNSAAVSYYPHNNWLILAIVFGLMALLVFLHIKRSFQFKYFILVLPALFAVWKYGMAREDYLHTGMYFLFLVMIILLLNLIIVQYRVLTFVIGILIILLSFQNLRNAYYFEPPVFSVSGFRTISGALYNYSFIADTCEKGSERNIQRNRLDNDILSMIGQATTDIFPWDYSFIPANNLNWIPRPVLQSYASYTPWLDRENASHFQSARAPQYLLWELRKITHDIHNGTMESIDGRYLLNDQPEAVLSILTNYGLVTKQSGTFPVLVLEKRRTPLHPVRKVIKSGVYSWNTWVDVPNVSDGILRANTVIDRNWLGDVKSFLYKDEACYIYYQLSNGEIRMYHIVPKNAAQGIWVNPLFMNTENSLVEPTVSRVMFRCTNPALMKSEIAVSWEHIELSVSNQHDTSSKFPFATSNLLFGKDRLGGNKIILNKTNDLETIYPYWSFNQDPEKFEKAFSGSTSCRVNGKGYSVSYCFPLDSLAALSNDSTWLIRTSAWINAMNRIDAILVISIEKDGTSLLWKPVDLDNFVIENNTWNYACNFLEVTHDMVSKPGMKLKVYIWNKGKTSLLTDDMQVIIEK
jgi:hypothetical protein